jgi:hypothetical protein
MFVNLDVVRYLDQIVNLDAILDPGFSKTGTINGNIGTYLNIIAQLDNAQLHNFLPGSICIRRVAKAVTTNHGTIMDNDTVPKDTAFTNRYMRVKATIGADDGSMSNIATGNQHRPITDDCTGLDHNMRPDRHILAQRHILRYGGSRMYAWCIVHRRRRQHHGHISKSTIRILNVERCTGTRSFPGC